MRPQVYSPLKITFSYRMEKVGRPDEKVKGERNIIKKIWSKIIKEEDNIDLKKFAEPVDIADSLAKGRPGDTVQLYWFIKNNTNFKWPKEGVYLGCKSNVGIMHRIYVTDRLLRG
jgi:hypothetical protein